MSTAVTLNHGYTLAGQGALSGITLGSHNNSINLSIVKANGGWVVSISNNGFSQPSNLHIINEDADLGVELGKLITIHCLKE
jgi:hypothetical protein